MFKSGEWFVRERFPDICWHCQIENFTWKFSRSHFSDIRQYGSRGRNRRRGGQKVKNKHWQWDILKYQNIVFKLMMSCVQTAGRREWKEAICWEDDQVSASIWSPSKSKRKCRFEMNLDLLKSALKVIALIWNEDKRFQLQSDRNENESVNEDLKWTRK